MYGGGRAMWYPGRGRSSWALLLLAMGEGRRMAVCRSVHLAFVGEYQTDDGL